MIVQVDAHNLANRLTLSSYPPHSPCTDAHHACVFDRVCLDDVHASQPPYATKCEKCSRYTHSKLVPCSQTIVPRTSLRKMPARRNALHSSTTPRTSCALHYVDVSSMYVCIVSMVGPHRTVFQRTRIAHHTKHGYCMGGVLFSSGRNNKLLAIC